MSIDEKRPAVSAEQVFGDLLISPLPEGTVAEAAFVLLKLDNGDWSARVVGDGYNRLEFLGSLMAYTHAQTVEEASSWEEDADDTK